MTLKRHTMDYGKSLNDFYSLVTTHQKPISFASFFDASQLVNENRSCTLPME